MNIKQLSLFPDTNQDITEVDNSAKICNSNEDEQRKYISLISERLFEEFSILQIPFLGCNFENIYPKVSSIMPADSIDFYQFGLETSIACELICAAICHQINWDFLRNAIYIKTKGSPQWVHFDNLIHITEMEVAQILQGYKKPERIRASERAELLREVGIIGKTLKSYKEIFLDEHLNIYPLETVRNNLLCCSTFSCDPSEKKLQLLLQKLSKIKELSGLASYSQPAVDYHIIRCYLRRGLLYPQTQYAKSFISAPSTQRKERTVGALRQLCGELMQQISRFTLIDINTINLVDWNIGRSVCIENDPDCFLTLEGSKWLKNSFNCCPFYETCVACHEKKDYLKIREPLYKGKSY